MDIKCRIGVERIAPDLIEKLFLRDYRVPVLVKAGQKREFLGFQIHNAAFDRAAHGGRIDRESVFRSFPCAA